MSIANEWLLHKHKDQLMAANRFITLRICLWYMPIINPRPYSRLSVRDIWLTPIKQTDDIHVKTVHWDGLWSEDVDNDFFQEVVVQIENEAKCVETDDSVGGNGWAVIESGRWD